MSAFRSARDAFDRDGIGSPQSWFRGMNMTIINLYERNEKLEAVVRALAESDPEVDFEDADPWCCLCSIEDDKHAPSCPWRMARELTEGAT